MLRLILFRHAKSAWHDPTLADNDRPLADRGRQAAPVMADAMADLSIDPYVIRCSSSLRTRQTLELVLANRHCAAWRSRVTYDDGLYLAEPAAILAHLAALPPVAREVMVVGHNPGLQDTAVILCGDGPEPSLRALRRKVPTASLIVIDFDHLDAWSEIAPASGRLRHFVTPASRGLVPTGDDDGD
jgi:phosphohistidine phosphatase